MKDSVRRKTRRGGLLAILWLFLLMPTFYYLYQQHSENKLVDNYIEENQLQNLPITKETAFLVSDRLRGEFNIKVDTYKHLKFSKRPFLRESCAYLLTYKEGLCGEGSRVLVNILGRMGFDATRVTLYNRKLHSSHTLVSVLINKNEYLVDSINSSQEVNRFLRNNDVSTTDFNVMKYVDDLDERKRIARAPSAKEKSEDYEVFFNKYWLYSYEAKPYSKIFSKLGLGLVAFNLERPGKHISFLAEKPSLIMAYSSFIMSIIILWIINKLGIITKLESLISKE